VLQVTKGGRARFFIVVVGDENGVVGHGLNLKMFLRQSRKRKMLRKI
jgi:ribosomal protein S5